jgi:hypothetical protein
VHISVAISLSDGETLAHTPEEAAQIIMDAFDEVHDDKDFCSVMITSAQTGSVGYVAPPEPAPEPGDPGYIEPAPPPPIPTLYDVSPEKSE